MQAGFYDADITPPLGSERAASYEKLYLREVHDPLKARAAVFSDGPGRRVALVGLDLLTIPSSAWVRRVRREIARQCGIPASAVLLAASHTHNGPSTFGAEPAAYARAPALIRRLALDLSPIQDPAVMDWLARQTVSAVVEADRRKQEALLAVGRGREDSVAFNRRFRMRQGRALTHPGKGNPDIVGPAGPTDPEVGVIGAWRRRGGAFLGCVVNFACHGTTLAGEGISADWIYYLEQTLRGVLGRDAGVVFLNGACGDVTQVDNQSRRPFESGERWARIVGTRVGAEALKALVAAERGALRPLAWRQALLRIPRRRAAPARLRAARREVAAGLKDDARRRATAWTFAKELLLADYLAAVQPVVPVEVQAVQIGPAVLVSNPAEFFCGLGLRIKAASPFPHTFVVELANGSVGYVPGCEAFRADGGGYETALTSYSNLATDAGERIVRAAGRLLAGLRPGRVPCGPRVPPGRPWSYGVLGPDA